MFNFLHKNIKISRSALEDYDRYMEKKYEERPDKDNIFCVGITDQEFRKFVIDIILGPDWYAPSGVSSVQQVNEEALNTIIAKLCYKE